MLSEISQSTNAKSLQGSVMGRISLTILNFFFMKSSQASPIRNVGNKEVSRMLNKDAEASCGQNCLCPAQAIRYEVHQEAKYCHCQRTASLSTVTDSHDADCLGHCC